MRKIARMASPVGMPPRSDSVPEWCVWPAQAFVGRTERTRSTFLVEREPGYGGHIQSLDARLRGERASSD
jgi:hypothetical protein